MERIALSIKQPWATLVVHGIKTLEIRRWSTKRRGEIYIHTGRGVANVPAAWDLVPTELQEFAQLRGGIVGKARLVGCRRYETLEKFGSDVKDHRVPIALMTPFGTGPLYGFEFTEPEVIQFEECKGSLYFFPIDTSV